MKLSTGQWVDLPTSMEAVITLWKINPKWSLSHWNTIEEKAYQMKIFGLAYFSF